MGWWKVEGTQNVIGDEPLDTLSAAVSEVIAAYEVSFQRRPTKAEWEAQMTGVLGGEEHEERALDDGIVTKMHLDVK